tara:strand:+ start:1924 stop:2238 length:315 start_codon:yes stop_codon:yes gene_type:complete
MLEYTYVNHPAAEKNQAIKIKNNDYKDIVFTFGRVSFYEVDDTPHIKFDYNVLEGEDPETEDFINLLGDIVVDIMEREFKLKEQGVFVDESDYRENDTKESSEE